MQNNNIATAAKENKQNKIYKVSKKLIGLIILAASCTQPTPQFHYPPTKEIPVTDDYFGTKIIDNYRWLEDLKNDTVQAWFKAQANFTDSIIGKIKGRDSLFNRMKEYNNMKGDILDGVRLVLVGKTYFYAKTKKSENLPKLYRRTLPDGAEELLFDPETAEKGARIMNFTIDDAGTKIALALSVGGAEIGYIRIFNCADKKLLEDKIESVDNEPFHFANNATAISYTKMNMTGKKEDYWKNEKVMLHTIGSNPQNDKIIFSREKYPALNVLPEQNPSVTFSNDKKYVFLRLESVQNDALVYYANAGELNNATINWKPLISLEDEITDYKIIGDKLFFLTHKNAPNYKIGVTSISNPDFNNAKFIVPEGKDIIKYIDASKNYFFYELGNSMKRDVYQIDPGNYSSAKLPLPEGVNFALPLNATQNDKLIAVNFGWFSPITIYEYDAGTKAMTKSKWFDMTGNYPDFSKDYAVKEVEVKSHDGAMVPLSIVYPKNIKMNGSTPCYMEGYGSYGHSLGTQFIGWEMSMLEQGCIYAVAHVRGGGEKGESWHKAGMRANKPNTWKDFIACAEYLIDNKYTSNKKLIGEGASAGGILIGRAITERPDLFAVAIVHAGKTNMLRNEMLTPNGDSNIPEYGSVKIEEEAKWLLEMDAQTKVKKGVHYPAVLVRTGMNDPRLISKEAAKFTGILQNSSASGKPVLLHVSY
ncbi:MAG: prolyl oligopeptidase family serine peptidase, partial [Chitinophagaceae bacterium]|nr:prolyl oligopeptidase family serine peptidase [Chitinophagaceae bacterium]